MKNKTILFDRFFHFVAGVVDLYAFIVLCNSIIDSDGTNWGFKEWSTVITAIFVTLFMIIYKWVKGNDGSNDSNNKPSKNRTVNLYSCRIYKNCRWYITKN